MKENLLGRIGRAAIELICGPEIKGTVEFVKRDQNVPQFWHVLVKTEQGAQRYVIWKDRTVVINSRGLERMNMPWNKGDRFQANMRGNGILWEGPGAIKLEEDPFNLKQN